MWLFGQSIQPSSVVRGELLYDCGDQFKNGPVWHVDENGPCSDSMIMSKSNASIRHFRSTGTGLNGALCGYWVEGGRRASLRRLLEKAMK